MSGAGNGRGQTSRTGIFGGTFNPPHLAHRVVAEQAVAQLRLDRLIWMTAARSPHKSGSEDAAPHHRLAMVSLAAADHPRFAVSALEIDRSGPSFTVDTLKALKAAQPEDALVLLVGADSWRFFRSWRSPQTILDMAEVAVYPRGAWIPADTLTPADGQDYTPTWVDSPRIEISSTDIRNRLREGRPVDGLIDGRVLDYIRSNGLYGASSAP